MQYGHVNDAVHMVWVASLGASLASGPALPGTGKGDGIVSEGSVIKNGRRGQVPLAYCS